MNEKICIVGLGYVGLPLAVLFNRKFRVVGFDINKTRVGELKDCVDRTKEISGDELKNCTIEFTDDQRCINDCGIIVVTVPTPIDDYKIPDLKPVIGATQTIAKNMRKGSTIVYESTVYPGLTEEVCVPILEKVSGLKWKKDFFVGYSPERVNPGDKLHTVEKITKVVSGDTAETLELVSDIYGAVINNIHKAENIKTAEAAKVIENTQRDLNIALVNELSLIFNRMGISTKAVLEAAGTKWNFLKFEPGLVGGHCIGVDPYYLTYKAESIGYHPQVILAGRRINDSMGPYIAQQTVKKLIEADKTVRNSKVLILGITFKENIGDIRNSKVFDIYRELREYGIDTYVYDPHAYKEEVRHEYGIELIDKIDSFKPYDAVIIAVKHREFAEGLDIAVIKAISNGGRPVIIDIKGLLGKAEADKADGVYWNL